MNDAGASPRQPTFAQILPRWLLPEPYMSYGGFLPLKKSPRPKRRKHGNGAASLTAGAISLACIAAAVLLGHVVGLPGFWPLVLLSILGMIVGNVLGRLVCRLLFGPPSGGPPHHPPRA